MKNSDEVPNARIADYSNILLKFFHLGVYISSPDVDGVVQVSWYETTSIPSEIDKIFVQWFECSEVVDITDTLMGFQIYTDEYETIQDFIEDLEQVFQEVCCRATVDIKKLIESGWSISKKEEVIKV